MEDETLRLIVALVSGNTIGVDAPPQWRFRDLQETLQERTGIPVREQQLFAGDVCLRGGLLAEQSLGKILGKAELLTLARRDRSLTVGAAVFCGLGDQPQIFIDGNETVLKWCESYACFYGEEDVRPDDRTSESDVLVALNIPSLRVQYDAYVDCSIFTQPAFVPLRVQAAQLMPQLHVGPTFFSEILCHCKYKRQHPFIQGNGFLSCYSLSLEIWLWCKIWEDKLPQDEMFKTTVKALTGKTVWLSMPCFSPMLVAEMLYYEKEGCPLSDFFLYHPSGYCNVLPTQPASELQKFEKEPKLHALMTSGCLGPHRKPGADDKVALRPSLCSQLEQAPPLHREALEHLNSIIFEGVQQKRIISGEGIGDFDVGAAVTFVELRDELWKLHKNAGWKGSSLSANLDDVWQRWKLLELRV